jgi:hypothetical protein
MAYYNKPYEQVQKIWLKTPVGRVTMGPLIFGGVIVLAVFLAIVLMALLSMAKRTDQIYEFMCRGEEITSLTNP